MVYTRRELLENFEFARVRNEIKTINAKLKKKQRANRLPVP